MTIHAIAPVTLDGPAALVHQLRKLADELEATGTARTVLVIVDDSKGVDFSCLGYRPRRSETLGMLAFASHMVFEMNSNG